MEVDVGIGIDIFRQVSNRLRSGSAMAEVISGACQACGMKLTSQEHNQVLKSSGIVTCKSCARILYSEGE